MFTRHFKITCVAHVRVLFDGAVLDHYLLHYFRNISFSDSYYIIYYVRFIFFTSQLKKKILCHSRICLYTLNTRPINICQMSFRNVYSFIITLSFIRSVSLCFILINFPILRCDSLNSTVIQNPFYS